MSLAYLDPFERSDDDYEPSAWTPEKPALVAGPGTALVPLTGGYEVLIDAGDYYLLQGHSFYAHKARSNTYARNKKLGYLHSILCPAPAGYVTDHKNRNSLDCRRSNLRVISRGANASNAEYSHAACSGYRGVYQRANGRFQARIKCGLKTTSLGTFDTALEASAAYETAAIKAFGDAAFLQSVVAASSQERRLPDPDCPF